MATTSKIPWDKLKVDTLRAICRDFGANPGKRKREGMLEFLRAVETADRASRPRLAHPHRSSPLSLYFATSISPPIIGPHTVDEALKLNIEDKEESSPRRPTTKRARHAEEHPAGANTSRVFPRGRRLSAQTQGRSCARHRCSHQEPWQEGQDGLCDAGRGRTRVESQEGR